MKYNNTLNNEDRNCGLCGVSNCNEFRHLVNIGQKRQEECVYCKNNELLRSSEYATTYDEVDLNGRKYDFVLNALPNEISARKIIQPFRPDLVEKLNIKVGDIVIGRPMGAGCPVTHALKVYDVDVISGLLYTWVVGPLEARKNNVIDIKNYYMVGFEGIISNVNRYPKFGQVHSFLPSFCMLRLNHSGLVNQLMEFEDGNLLVRIENISIG